MLIEGVNLMAVGMATVFSFLALLVMVLQVSARVFEKFGDRWPDSTVEPGLSGASSGTSGNEEIAVVLAAVEARRRQQG